MSQAVNYLDLIKNPRMKAGKNAGTLKNNSNNMKENTYVQSSPSSAASSYGKKSKNLDSDCLGELDIRQLTNTRHKHKKNKEIISGNVGMLTKEEQQRIYQLNQCPNSNQQTLMQNSYLLRKNQQSPLVQYNREAERFSYVYDPILGSQMQEQNPAQTREYQQQFQASQQLLQRNQINSLKLPSQQQYLNYSNTANLSYPQQQQQQQQWSYQPKSQYLPDPYCNQRDFQGNYKNINQEQYQYQNSHKFNQEPLVRQDLLTLNNEINRMQQFQQKQQQQQLQPLHYLGSTASTDSFVSCEEREDSFGNINQRHFSESNPTTAANNLTKYYTEQKYSPYGQQQQTPDLQRYYRKPQGIYQVGQNKPTGSTTRRLLPSVNISTVVFAILAMYVVYKNFSKIKGAAETIQYYVFSGATTTNRAGKQNDNNNIHAQSPLLTPSQSNAAGFSNSQEFQSQQWQQQHFDNSNQSEQARQEKQDAAIAKAFAKELIKELFMQLREKKWVYKDEYQDNLTHRFSTNMLREILPELNKVLLNSREIRIQFDVMKQSEYYELKPEETNSKQHSTASSASSLASSSLEKYPKQQSYPQSPLKCAYCKRTISKSDDQTPLCSCNICDSCSRTYLREVLKTNQPVLKCPMNEHRLYYDTLLNHKVFRSILNQSSNGKVEYMLLTLAVIFLIGSSFLEQDRNMQLNFVLLLLYLAKADVQPKHKYYFIYAMYFPIVYWFCTKNSLEFIQMMSPLHAIWFGFVHTELRKPQKMKLFLVWIAQIIWQALFYVARYYLIPFLFVD